MENSNLITAINAYKNKEITKSSISVIIKSILKNDLETPDNIRKFKQLIEIEQSPDLLLDLYWIFESFDTERSQTFTKLMEETLGERFIKNYNVHPREAMALGLVEKIIGQELLNEADYPEYHHVYAVFRVSEGYIIGLFINEVYVGRLLFLDLFPFLKRLRISAANLTEIKGLDTLVGLKCLDLHVNNLKELSDLENLSKLEELYIDSNPLTSVKGIDKLKNLRKVDMTDTKLTKKRFVKIFNSIPYNWFVKGVLSFNKHQYNDAMKSFKKAVSLNHYYAEAWYYLGLTYKKRRKINKASKAYQQAIKSLRYSNIILLPTNLVFEDYQDKLINKSSAFRVYQSLIEYGEYEHIQIESIICLSKLDLFLPEHFEYLKSLLENHQDEQVRGYAGQILIKNFPSKAYGILKEVISNEKDEYCLNLLKTALNDTSNTRLKSLLQLFERGK
ncbi:MAG: tetratricopeptide repeat protein [Candidatus Thorarchaeota archaeon]